MIRTKWIIAPSFLVFTALFILLLPQKWFVAWLLATAVHELCHYIILRICDVNIKTIHIKAFGIVMDTDLEDNKKECACAIAGPIGSFFVASCITRFPMFGFFGMVHLIYNLIPIYPSDGGRVLRCIVLRYIPRRGQPLLNILESVSILVLLSSLIFASLRLQIGLLPLIALMLFCLLQRKIPCKPS